MCMDAKRRREEIEKIIGKNGSIRVADISRLYGVSNVTARSDLEYLESKGKISRTHGGAVATGKLYSDMDVGERYMTNANEKRELAALVARLVEDNDTIMLNAGTTLTYVIQALQTKKNLSIVTNSIQNAVQIGAYPGFNVVLLGGEIDTKYQFTYGNDAICQLDRYHVNKCILSVDGVHTRDGLTLYYSNEVGVVRKMIDSSDKVIVAADGSKIGRNTFSKIAPIEVMEVLVTSRSDKRDQIAEIKSKGITVCEA